MQAEVPTNQAEKESEQDHTTEGFDEHNTKASPTSQCQPPVTGETKSANNSVAGFRKGEGLDVEIAVVAGAEGNNYEWETVTRSGKQGSPAKPHNQVSSSVNADMH